MPWYQREASAPLVMVALGLLGLCIMVWAP